MTKPSKGEIAARRWIVAICRPGAATRRSVPGSAQFVPLAIVACAADPAVAEVSDKVEETLAGLRIGTCALLFATGVAAVAGWRRILPLWPVTALWGLIATGTDWEWHEELWREGRFVLLSEGVLTGAAMLLAPPLFTALARRWRRARAG